MSGSDDSAKNRRRYERTAVALLVQYRFNTFEDFLAEYAVDLSPGGMFIHTQETAEPGAMIHLQFSLKDGSRLIEGLGRVVRVRAPGPGVQSPGLGVEFVEFDDASRALIRRICDDVARPPRPRSNRPDV